MNDLLNGLPPADYWTPETISYLVRGILWSLIPIGPGPGAF